VLPATAPRAATRRGFVLGSLLDDQAALDTRELHQNNIFFLGEAQRRDRTVDRVYANADGQPMPAPGSSAQPRPPASGPPLTPEYALHTLLFPDGCGFNRGAMQPSDYTTMRARQLFTPFTIVNEYSLLSFQVGPCARFHGLQSSRPTGWGIASRLLHAGVRLGLARPRL
jgi:hypothetical protein